MSHAGGARAASAASTRVRNLQGTRCDEKGAMSTGEGVGESTQVLTRSPKCGILSVQRKGRAC